MKVLEVKSHKWSANRMRGRFSYSEHTTSNFSLPDKWKLVVEMDSYVVLENTANSEKNTWAGLTLVSIEAWQLKCQLKKCKVK